ncbi:MAG: sensor histidine kinase [Thermoanaerobaculales bacterium]
MHPILAYRGRLGAYLAAWVPLAGLLTGALHESAGYEWLQAAVLAVPLALLYAFICLAAWYPCRAASPRLVALPRVIVTQLVAAGLSAMLWLFLADTWAVFLEQFPRFGAVGERFPGAVPVLLAGGVLLYALAAALHYLLMAFEEARRAQTQALELEVLAREAELRALRAQIDPHFLFNSLNSISALIGSDPRSAREMCLRLADFLRESLRVGSATSIPLAEEVALAERYLAIEQARFGSRLRTEWAIAPEVQGCQVPPLLLQPLVENAVRHGIACSVTGGCVRVMARRSGEMVRVEVENPADTEVPAAAGAGLGLANVRSRLAATFGSAAALEVRQADGVFCVALAFPAGASIRA